MFYLMETMSLIGTPMPLICRISVPFSVMTSSAVAVMTNSMAAKGTMC